ncbi:phosphoserine phosphatase SerB [Gammaproteobacteria bacterium]|nr:phosphoserine phosphatase SerB [Gammaproteobacteria bacterium]
MPAETKAKSPWRAASGSFRLAACGERANELADIPALSALRLVAELQGDGLWRSAPTPLDDAASARRILADCAAQLGVDACWQPHPAPAVRLVCFDMDSTLIEAECIVELAREHGVGDQVHAVTERAMRGELDFADSFRQRMSLLGGLPEAALAKVRDRIHLFDGVEALIASLQAAGIRRAIFSGGFSFVAGPLAKRLAVERLVTHDLEIVEGYLTGRIVNPSIVDAARKASELQRYADELTIELASVVAIGDGANDLPMMAASGCGVAWRGKPAVQAEADIALNHTNYQSLPFLLGID